MGKRKLHNACFYQCDWTGFPMKHAHCYMPQWTAASKLVKKGSYCNWESVMAHATLLRTQGAMTQDAFDKVSQHIEFITGCHVQCAPHYEELQHTKGRMDALAFHDKCCSQDGPVAAVKISPDGEVFEIMLVPNEQGKITLADYMHKPYTPHSPSVFHSMRKKGSPKGTDRDLSVWYFASKELQINSTASNLFKMQLHGDVLLVQQSREASFLPRERFVTFTKQNYDDHFAKKRRKSALDTPSLTPRAYQELKDQMQASLNQFEERAAQTALAPHETAKALSLGPMSGKSLASKMLSRGYERPQKHPRLEGTVP